ncbi:MAG: hypothetical protein AAGN82_26475 [Myxococcota bacterium]
MVELTSGVAALGAAGLVIAARDPSSRVGARWGYAGALLGYLASTVAAAAIDDGQSWWLVPLVAFTAGFTAVALLRPTVGRRAWFDVAAGVLTVAGVVGAAVIGRRLVGA